MANVSGLWLFYLDTYIQQSPNSNSLCDREDIRGHRDHANNCLGSHSIKEMYLALLLLD